jgi:hypothetical protein
MTKRDASGQAKWNRRSIQAYKTWEYRNDENRFKSRRGAPQGVLLLGSGAREKRFVYECRLTVPRTDTGVSGCES